MRLQPAVRVIGLNGPRRRRLGQHRQEPRAEAEQEDRRGDQADRDAPLEDRRRIGLRRAPGHAAPERHREQDDVHAVVARRRGRRAALPRRADRAGAESALRARRTSGTTPPSRISAAKGAPSLPGERAGELVAKRHVAEPEHEVDEQRPERDLPHRGERRHLERAAPPLRDPHLDQDDEGASGRDRGQEEGDRASPATTTAGRACSASAGTASRASSGASWTG